MSAARVGDCFHFFNLDAFDAQPVDTQMLLRQL
jgi:hypothetical protein